jgi:hypothetical protein
MNDSPYTIVPPVKFSVIISLFRLFRETFQFLGLEMFQVRLQKKILQPFEDNSILCYEEQK